MCSCFTALLPVSFSHTLCFHLFIFQFDIQQAERGVFVIYIFVFCQFCIAVARYFWFISCMRHIISFFPPSLFLIGFEVREAKQHARKWLWQHIQWVWDGGFGVRTSPRMMVWSELMCCFACGIKTTSSDIGSRHDFFCISLCSLGRRGRLRSSGWFGEGSSIPELDDLETESDPTLPSTEDVIRKTEQITKNIQELLRAAQENKHDRLGSEEKLSFWFVFFSFLFFAVISNSDFLLHSWLFCYLFSCVYLLSFPLFFVCYLHSSSPHSTSTLLRCFDVVLVSRCPRPFTPVSRPCEREGVRRLRHSLGCFSTLVPWAEKAPTPLQPLSLRSPDPTSWYSGLCPCLPGTVLFSSTLPLSRVFFFCLTC